MRRGSGYDAAPPLVAAILGYLVLQFAIGAWVSRLVRTEDDYLVGGRPRPRPSRPDETRSGAGDSSTQRVMFECFGAFVPCRQGRSRKGKPPQGTRA